MSTPPLPPWPPAPPAHGGVLLRPHRVQLFVEPSNEASVRTARGAGYEPEGLLRSYQEIGGRHRDVLVFAAVRENQLSDRPRRGRCRPARR